MDLNENTLSRSLEEKSNFLSSRPQVITSQEKEITIKKPNGETTTATVRIWNETVSNLTLMALGSSAPEILLSVIEVGTTAKPRGRASH